MKKAIIILGMASLVIFGGAYYFMQKSSNLISKSDQAVLNTVEVINNVKKTLPKRLVKLYRKDGYYYKNLDLSKENHIIINNCLQYYVNDNSFEDANRCEELIVDAIIKNIGEVNLIKALIGDVISYENDISLKSNFPRNLFSNASYNASLKSQLILTFINRYRDPVKLQTEFDNYKLYFFDIISKNLYTKLFENYLNTFIESYDEIQQQEDKESFFKRIYYEAETKNRQGELWNLTFWKRRELEKNDQIIYSILKEIKAHYKN